MYFTFKTMSTAQGKLSSLWWGHIWSTGCSSSLPTSKKTRNCWRETSEGQKRWLGNWRISFLRKGWETWVCSDWKREDQEPILSVVINFWKKDVKWMGPGFLLWYPATGQVPSELATWQSPVFRVSFPGDVKDPPEHFPVQTTVENLLWQVILD